MELFGKEEALKPGCWDLVFSRFSRQMQEEASRPPASSVDAGARLLQGLVLSKGPSRSLRTELRGGEIKQSAVLGT